MLTSWAWTSYLISSRFFPHKLGIMSPTRNGFAKGRGDKECDMPTTMFGS